MESFRQADPDHIVGGKAKPLKAPKKDKKEVDEDDLAFQAKQRAGLSSELDLRGVSKADLWQMQRRIRKWQRRPKGKAQ